MSVSNCPNCGAPVNGEHGQKLLSCEYCGSSFANPFYTEEDRSAGSAPKSSSSSAPDFASSGRPMPQQPTPQPVVIVPPKASEKSLKAAQFWAIILGFYGIHRFYAGKIGTGLIWMFTGGCFFIGWIYDVYTLSGQRFTDSKGRRIVSKSSILTPDNTLACSACGHSLEDSAAKCPNCGLQIKKWWQTGLGFVLVWILLGILTIIPASCSRV